MHVVPPKSPIHVLCLVVNALALIAMEQIQNTKEKNLHLTNVYTMRLHERLARNEICRLNRRARQARSKFSFGLIFNHQSFEKEKLARLIVDVLHVQTHTHTPTPALNKYRPGGGGGGL